MTDSNPILDAIEAGHVTSKIDVDGFLQYTDKATCLKDGQPFPCQILLAARANNARREAARSRAELRRLSFTGVP